MRLATVKKGYLWVSIIVLASGVLLPLLSAQTKASGLSLDKTISTHQSSAATSISSPALTTAQANELLVAFITSDGPGTSGSQSISSVTGGSLTWTLCKRTNAQPGTAEIWTAWAANPLSSAVIKATRAKGSYRGDITIAAFEGASSTIGAVNGSSATSGAPNNTLTTTTAGAWVWGVGNDYDNAVSRTIGSNQTLVDQYLSPSGDTYWTQRQNAVTPSAGTAVTINDTAPTGDRWDLSTIEILPGVVDVTPPTVPTNLSATANSTSQVGLSWAASSDDTGVAGYNVYRNSVQIGTTTATSYTDNTVAANTSYTYTVQALDASGNASANSDPASVTTPADTTPPVISNVASSAVTTTSANISWTTDEASTSQIAYGETAAYGSTTTLDSTLATSHSQALSGLSASTTYHYQVVSTDASGNTATSADNTFTTPAVNPTAPTIDPSTPAATKVANNVSTTTSPSFSPPANTVIYAVFSMDSASYNGTITTVQSVTNSGTPLTWHLLGRNNNYNSTTGGFLEVWWAYNPTAQTNIASTATFSQATKNVTPPVGDFQILVMDNAAPDQSAAAWNANWLISSYGNAPTVNVTTTKANSQVFGVFDNWNNSETPIPGTNQSIQSIVLNTADVDGYWIQKQNSPTATAGTSVTMNATDPGSANQWRAIAWEVLAN